MLCLWAFHLTKRKSNQWERQLLCSYKFLFFLNLSTPQGFEIIPSWFWGCGRVVLYQTSITQFFTQHFVVKCFTKSHFQYVADNKTVLYNRTSRTQGYFFEEKMWVKKWWRLTFKWLCLCSSSISWRTSICILDNLKQVISYLLKSLTLMHFKFTHFRFSTKDVFFCSS